MASICLEDLFVLLGWASMHITVWWAQTIAYKQYKDSWKVDDLRAREVSQQNNV